ncbi:MAG: T9SS type A sorting domain-containing protein [Chitinophagales bacterium]|nr:T9SS type A sorting domain-containing protein [Chitinophagales bacterium]
MKTNTLLINSILILALSCFFQFANAQIVYTDVNPDQTFNTNGSLYHLDLNNDGINDFDLTYTTSQTNTKCGLFYGINRYIRITSFNSNEVGCDFTDELPAVVYPASLIDNRAYLWKINANQNIATSEATFCTYNHYLGFYLWVSTYSGHWHHGRTNKYIALRLHAGSQVFYGWIRLDIGTNAINFTVKDYAFNSVPDSSILAGETTCSFPISIDGNSSVCAGDSTTLTATGGISYLWNTGETTASIVVSPTQLTNYTVEIRDTANSCSEYATVPVTVKTVIISVTLQDNTIKANATNASYQWIDCNTMLPIPGATDQSFTATQSGSYAVQIIQNGCTDTSICYSVLLLGISENAFSNFMKLSPNPAFDKITLSFSLKEKAELQITNLLGQIVYSEKLNAQDSRLNTPVDVSQLPMGMYLITVKTSDQNFEDKFLKQ